MAGPVACAAAWEDSVLREHEEELRRKRSGRGAVDHLEVESDDEEGIETPRRQLLHSLPPLPPLPARQVDGSTLASPAAEGIGIGGFVTLALGAAERAAEVIRRVETAKLDADADDPLLAVAFARAAVSARSARRVMLGAASYARRAAAAAGQEGNDENAAAEEEFLEGLSVRELQAASKKAAAAVEAAAALLGVRAHL